MRKMKKFLEFVTNSKILPNLKSNRNVISEAHFFSVA